MVVVVVCVPNNLEPNQSPPTSANPPQFTEEGQDCVLHPVFSLAVPLQSFPPCSGGVQIRFLDFVPPPQVWEQDSQLPHFDQNPSFGQGWVLHFFFILAEPLQASPPCSGGAQL